MKKTEKIKYPKAMPGNYKQRFRKNKYFDSNVLPIVGFWTGGCVRWSDRRFEKHTEGDSGWDYVNVMYEFPDGTYTIGNNTLPEYQEFIDRRKQQDGLLNRRLVEGELKILLHHILTKPITAKKMGGAPLSALPEKSAKNPVYYFGNSLNNAIFAGVWNDKAYSELCLIQKYIKDETIRYERLAQERFGGENAADSIRRSVIQILGGSRSTSATFRASGKGVSSQFDRDAAAIRAFAEYRGLWHSDAVEYVVHQLGCTYLSEGKEARVYCSKDSLFVYKIKNVIPQSKTGKKDLLTFFDELTNHNILFPETAYEICGFGLDNYGRFCTILKQNAIEGRPATSDEIESHFTNDVFNRQNRYAFYKDGYIISDLKPSNVVFSNGKCYVIDCFAQTIFDFDNNFYISNTENKHSASRSVRSAKISFSPLSGSAPYSGNGGRKDTTERGILDEYYTPDYVCEFMYALAVKYGYKAGKVLEPSCATGNIIRPIYERNDYTHIDAFEINQTSRDICKKLFPNVTIYDNYFETAFLEPPRFSTKAKRTWLKNAPYDLIVGNPPYGKHVNRYSSYFSGKDKFTQIEMFFMFKGLQLLRPGGLLVFITSTNFMSTGNAYQQAKERIGEIADLVDAYRLPKVFERTDICTDIIVLRKK